MLRRLRTAARATGLLVGCGTAAGGAWWLSLDLVHPVLQALTSPGPAGLAAVSFTEALDAVCATVLLGCVGWLAVVTALTVASYAAAVLSPGGSTSAVLDTLAARGCPPRLRRLVLACLGVAIGAGAAAPAMAASVGPTDRPGSHAVVSDGVGGLALPDRTTGEAAAAPRRHVPGEPAGTVLVRPGDSLWAIASALLPSGASDHDVTAAWHLLHRANASRIGADPDLILPGTRLGVPDRLSTEREER